MNEALTSGLKLCGLAYLLSPGAPLAVADPLAAPSVPLCRSRHHSCSSLRPYCEWGRGRKGVGEVEERRQREVHGDWWTTNRIDTHETRKSGGKKLNVGLSETQNVKCKKGWHTLYLQNDYELKKIMIKWKKKRASRLQDKEKRKKKDQLKYDGVGERREENENEEEQNHGLKHLGTKWGTKREEGKGQGGKKNAKHWLWSACDGDTWVLQPITQNVQWQLGLNANGVVPNPSPSQNPNPQKPFHWLQERLGVFY